ncbi:MAG: choice-of-anchor J domain-containing protein [Paludibacteraceae bacterium]|nr:choice-of-anchor J domain-containing protein [Paludibacteraceae bacterium]
MKKFFSLIAAVLFAGSMMAESLLSIDFTQGQGEWTIDNKELGGLEFVWAQTSQYGMKATGYVGGNHATEAWLVSPAFDLSGVEAAKLSFSHARRYGSNDQLSVRAKAGESEWSVLEVSAWPDGSNWNYIDATADLAAFVGKADVQVAFVYTSTTEGGATWEIKTVSVTDGDAPEPPAEEGDAIFTGNDFMGQGTSNTGSLVTATKNGVTFTCDKGYNDDAHATLRCYKNGVITITSETEQIGKLVFQFYQTYNGGLAEEVVVNAKEWNYTLASQARIEKLTIFFGDGGDVPPVPTVDTITVAQALEIGKALQVSDKSNKYPSEKSYVIKGYTCAIEAMFDETYKNESFWVSDTKGERTKDNAVAFEVYRGKPNTEKEVGLDALVQFKCQILNFNGTIENYDGNPAVEVLEQGEFHVDTLEASKAYDEALKLDKNATSLDFYAVKGFIHKVKTPYDETYKNATFYISDAMDDTDKDVNCYRATVNAADASKVVEGAYVIVTGHLMHNFYNDKSSAQLTSGVTEFTEAPKVDTIPVTVTEAVAIGLALPIEGKSDGIYAVTGFVNLVAEEFAEGVESFFLADEAESEVFNFYAVNALIAEAAEAGQRIEIVGRLQNADGETVTVDNGKARIIPGEGIENIVLTEKVQKVVVDGAIYIVRDGKMFNLQGAQVR